MQRNKSIKILINYVVTPILLVWLSASIYSQVRHQHQLAQSWQTIKQSFFSVNVFYLVAAVLLVLVNWGLEALKWKLLVKGIAPISFSKAYKAVLSGVSFSITMPNRVGEYVGRIMYMPDGSRLKTISATIVGSLAQLQMTVLFGIVGIIIIKQNLLQFYPAFIIWYQFILYGLIFLLLLLALLYFRVHNVFDFFSRWFRNNRYLYLLESVKDFHVSFLARLMFLSFLRYVVFLLQYILLFHLFGVSISAWLIIWSMSVVFLALAVIPSIALLELGLRGEVSLKIFAIFSQNSLGIGLTSVSVWFINLIIPAIIGTIFLLSVKLLRKNETE
ncbi:MAG: lysylphosphatidylglycerol synthase domain-containing protein [Candidatus Dadabacteria bacterium]